MRGLDGKVALVTGGSSGLGEAIVYRLAEEGVSLAVGGRDEARTTSVAARAAALARDQGREAEAAVVLGDVSDVADCERLVAVALARFGRLDILVNSAGVWLEKSILDTSEAEWDWCVDTCLKGTYFMCKAALRHMVPRRSGVIVNLASDSGIHGEPGAAVYSAAKAGVVMMTRALAIDPKLILLDEPCSGLDDNETHLLGNLLRELADEGRGVLLVEHDMSIVLTICDRIFVLDFGELIASGTPAEIRRDPRVQAAYLGTAPDPSEPEA